MESGLARSDTQRSTRWLLALILISLIATLWSQSPYLWDRYRVIKDVQGFFWIARYWDSELFPVDCVILSQGKGIIEVSFLGLRLMLCPVSLGYGLLFYLVGPLVDQIWLMKRLVFILMPLCVLILFKLGKRLRGNRTGLELGLLFVFIILASPQSISITSGLQRALTMPILILFLYFMTTGRYVWAALMVCFGLLFYAPMFPLMMLTYVFSIIEFRRSSRPKLDLTRSRIIPIAIVFVLSLLVLLLIFASQYGALGNLAPATCPISPLEESLVPADETSKDVPMSQHPLYQSEGPTPLFIVSPWFGRAGVFDTGGDILNFFVLLLFGVFIYLVLGPRSLRRLPGPFWCLLIATALMYAASLFALLQLSTTALYLPSRYTRGTLVLVALCFVGVNWADFWNSAPSWLRRNRRLLIFFTAVLGVTLAAGYMLFPAVFPLIPALMLLGLTSLGILAILGGGFLVWVLQHPISKILGQGNAWKKVVRASGLFAACVVTVLSVATYIRTLETKPINPSQAERDVYEFVSTLPKETMLVGESDVMTGIPLFSKRAVLFRRLFPREDAPIVEFFDAQYAESPKVVLDFCERYSVDYLVIDSAVFSPDYLARENFFYQPYNDEIVRLVAGRSDFVLPSVEPVFNSGSLSVIKCDAGTLLAGE
ncbi:MAG: hypothetical protein JXA14_06855 [Anaerolineae bacterium]|nr:hypothetical protein [Anaerolineae bacterium]